MTDKDVLGSFDYDQFGGAGLFLKFKADKPVTVRVLTLDPVVSQTEFTDKKTGEVNLNTRFSFIVYNFTEGKAQVLSASPAMSRKFGELHVDPDFGANIRNIDIKISPTGEGLERRYDIQVLPNARTLSAEQVREAQAIDLDTIVNDGKGRMSAWTQPAKAQTQTLTNGYDSARTKADEIKARKEADEAQADAEAQETYNHEAANEVPDKIVEDTGESFNLDEIPF